MYLKFHELCGKILPVKQFKAGRRAPHLGQKNMKNTEIKALKKSVIEKITEREKKNEARLKELEEKKMDFGGVSMKYEYSIIGQPGENGYPLYIALHGGGGSDTPDVNDQQWGVMQMYYKDSVESGIYLAPRGVRDTCDCHSNPESFPLYERLLSNLFLHYNIDPNRVYMLGYSAGGDGTMLVTPVMADRFAAGNESAGYTAERNYTNLYNMPLQFQVGENDYFYNRNVLFAKCVKIYENLKKRFGGGYESQFYMHLDRGHGFVDYDERRQEYWVMRDVTQWYENSDRTAVKVNSNAVDYINRFTRDPLPEKVVWDLSYRQPMMKANSFYWLNAEKTKKDGIVVARIEKETNSVIFESLGENTKINVLLHEDMLDLESEINVVLPHKRFKVKPEISEEVMKATFEERFDPNFCFAGKIEIQ